MNALVAFLSPLVLLVPAAAGELRAGPGDGAAHDVAVSAEGPKALNASPAEGLDVLKQAREAPELGQVRIEQRVVIRISPGPSAARQQMMSDLRRQAQSSAQYREERLKGCVPISGIAGMDPAPEENRLLLFMRDRRILSVALERACNARNFYSGFYVERNEDGQLCARRDVLQSRAGASCRVTQLNRLVAVRD